MNILVLNADMQPLNITTFKRGFNLVFTGKAEIIKSESDPIKTSIGDFLRPVVIRLTRYVYLPFKKVPISRNNIYKRDGNSCMYCGSLNDLTLDHVIPKSKGGGNDWDNLVTCCKKCNIKKDNLTPKEAGMKLRFKPYRPTFQQFALSMMGIGEEELKQYLYEIK